MPTELIMQDDVAPNDMQVTGVGWSMPNFGSIAKMFQGGFNAQASMTMPNIASRLGIMKNLSGLKKGIQGFSMNRALGFIKSLRGRRIPRRRGIPGQTRRPMRAVRAPRPRVASFRPGMATASMRKVGGSAVIIQAVRKIVRITAGIPLNQVSDSTRQIARATIQMGTRRMQAGRYPALPMRIIKRLYMAAKQDRK